MELKRSFALGIVLVLGLFTSVQADSQFRRMADMGKSAYNNGDFGLAARVWRQVMTRGMEKELVGRDQVVDDAIVSLARLHVSGKGVVKNPERAIEIAMIPARKGDTGAQGFIAERHFREDRYVEAYFWALLASRERNPRWEGLKYRVGLRLDDTQKSEVAERAEPWLKRGGVDPSV